MIEAVRNRDVQAKCIPLTRTTILGGSLIYESSSVTSKMLIKTTVLHFFFTTYIPN